MYRSFISTADSCNEDYAHRAVGVKVCKESASEFWHTSRILPRWQSHPWPRHTTELPSSPASRYCPCGDPPDASSRVDSRADPVEVDFGGSNSHMTVTPFHGTWHWLRGIFFRSCVCSEEAEMKLGRTREKMLLVGLLCMLPTQSVFGDPIPVRIAFQRSWCKAGQCYMNVTLLVHQDSDIEKINQDGNWNGGNWTLRGDYPMSRGFAEATIERDKVTVELTDAKGKHRVIRLRVESRAWMPAQFTSKP
jgi:hypothetical protein